MRIVFMGTPEFSVPSLKALIERGDEVAAVVTQPDRERGRGHRVLPSPVKTAAQRHGIPVLQFARIKSPEGVAALREAAPDMIVTAAFGQILSKEILDIPPMGCLNVHASLLPGYRGAAPIQWVIIKGETQSGVTIMYMNEGLDTGDMISSVVIPIGGDMTGGQLYDTLAQKGADLLVKTLDGISAGQAARTPQDEAEASYYPPLSRELGRIDWTKPAPEIRNLIRALNPVPGAFGVVCGRTIKIWAAALAEGNSEPGKIDSADTKRGLVVGTGDGRLRITEMQAQSGKRMTPEAYLRGCALPGERFELYPEKGASE
jgi:methionyl-tRNA formyltransferase